MCPNCHQHRYHRCKEFTPKQLLLYKKNLKEKNEIERRLLQNLEYIRKSLVEKLENPTERDLVRELNDASQLIDPTRHAQLSSTIIELAKELAESSILPEGARKAIEVKYEIERENIKSRFPKIQIISCDNDSLRKSNEFARAYEFVLILNSTPHPDWVDVFNKNYKYSYYNMKRKTKIIADRIVMIVADSDNFQVHIDWAKQLIQETNNFIHVDYFRQVDLEIDHEKKQALIEFDTIKAIKEKSKNLKI